LGLLLELAGGTDANAMNLLLVTGLARRTPNTDLICNSLQIFGAEFSLDVKPRTLFVVLMNYER